MPHPSFQRALHRDNYWHVPRGSYRGKLLYVLTKVVRSVSFNLLLGVSTIYALYADDIRLCALPKSVDYAMARTTTVVFFLFTVEFFLYCLAVPGYVNLPDGGVFLLSCKKDPGFIKKVKAILSCASFYFILDLVATVSLIPDVSLAICLPCHQSYYALKA